MALRPVTYHTADPHASLSEAVRRRPVQGLLRNTADQRRFVPLYYCKRNWRPDRARFLRKGSYNG